MNFARNEIFEIFNEIVTENGFFMIDFQIRGDKKRPVIELFIDGKSPVSADDCKLISVLVKQAIEENNIIDSDYRIDVSSPGVDRPLKFFEQYHKHINRRFDVKYSTGQDVEKITGKLVSISGNILRFEVNSRIVELDFDDIRSAKVLISF